MATQWISPTWRMPENSNQSKFENYSLNFNGSDNRIQIPYTDLNGSTNCTISFWAKINYAADSEPKYPLHLTSGTNNPVLWVFGASGTSLDVYIGTVNFRLDGSFNRDIAEWNHWVLRFDGSETSNNRTRVYQNGQQLTSQSGWGSATSIPTASHLILGGRNLNATQWFYQFPGDISDVSIFDYTLTEPQITSLYHSNTPINPMAITPPPITYYPLGGGSTGSAKDQSPNPNTLTVPNQAVPSATVFDFNGSSEHFLLPQVNTTGAITISCWVKSTGADYQMIYNEDEGIRSPAGSDRNFFYTIAFGKLRWSVWFATGLVTVNSSNNINDGNWHHTLGLWDGTNNTGGINIFIDGILRGTGTAGSTTRVNNTMGNNSSIIGGQYGTFDFDGDMANFQVWTTGLSYGSASSNGDIAGGDVATIYNNGVPLYTGTQPEISSLKFWNKLNVDTSNWNGSDWTISNSSANYTNSLQFNGTSSYIDTSSFTTSGDDVTISIWLNAINISASSPSTTGALVYGDANNFIYYNVNEVIYAKINGSTSILVANSGGVPQIFGTGNWHHLAVVKSGSTVTWYVDGSPFSDLGTGGSGGFTMNYIGAAGGSSIYFLDGQLSNVAIFESALDASAITTIYNSGQPETTISSSPLSWWKLDNLTTGIQDSGSASNNGTNYGATISGIAVSQENGTSNNMNTANLVTSDLTRSIPYSSYSLQFDGAGDNVGVSDSSVLKPSTITVSMWVKGGNQSTFAYFLSKYYTGGGTAYGFYTGATTDKIAFTMRKGDDSGWVTTAFSTVMDENWHNVIGTFDGTNVKLYVDGILTSTVASGVTGITYGSGDLTIGAFLGNGTLHVNAELSNISIFSSALTEDQILTIYNGGVPNDISSLSPVGWWSFAGDSYYNGSNFILPDLSGNNNNGTSFNMAGTELIGDGPGSTANGVATSMNIPGNLKGNAPNSSKNAFSVNMNSADRVTSVPG